MLRTLKINTRYDTDFKFLLQRYPDYRKLADQRISDTPLDHLAKVFQEYVTAETKTLDLAVILCLKEIFATPIYEELLPRTSLTSVAAKQKTAKETIEKLIRNDALKTSLNLFYSHRLLDLNSTTVGLDLALTALRLREHLDTLSRPTILFLGRTPDLIKKFLLSEYELYPTKQGKSPRIIHAAFSGTPDVENIRASAYYAHPDNRKAITGRNMVTEPKLLFYMHYLELLGLSKVTGPLVIVDLISTGSSMNAFLKLLYCYYQDFSEQSLPEISIAMLHPEYPPSKGEECPEAPFFFDFQKKTLHFMGSKEYGLWDMDVPANYFQTSETAMELLLDYAHFQTLAADVPEFPAQNWTPEGSKALTRGGYFHKEIYAGIKSEIATYVRQAHQEFQGFNLSRLLAKTKHNP